MNRNLLDSPAEWIDSLTAEEHKIYFDNSYVYLKVIDGKLESYADLATLLLLTKSEEYDMKVDPKQVEGYYLNDNGEIVLGIPLSNAKQNKLYEVQEIASNIIGKLKQGYLQLEIDTWTKQEKGAKDLAEDPNSTTSDAAFVRMMATNRGLDVNDLVRRILGHVQVSENITSAVLGHLQGLQDRIDAAQTREEVDAINWTLDLSTLMP